jgi:hypothetical protein
MRQAPILLVLLLATLLAACGSSPPPAAQLRDVEQRLLQPFLADVRVDCNELLIEMTGNFYPNVGQPALDERVHRRHREEGPGYHDLIWTNTLGQPETAFLITIGGTAELTATGVDPGPTTRFSVHHRVRLRVFQDRHGITLEVLARGVDGSPILLREPGAPGARQVREYRVEDGQRRSP